MGRPRTGITPLVGFRADPAMRALVMQESLAQSDVEWLRCLTVSRRLTPILPEIVQRRLKEASLIEEKAGKPVVTMRGAAVLRQR